MSRFKVILWGVTPLVSEMEIEAENAAQALDDARNGFISWQRDGDDEAVDWDYELLEDDEDE